MDKDPHKTIVLFRKEKCSIVPYLTAVFPELPGTRDPHTMACYARVGQHSACCTSWFKGTRAATPDEYAALTIELESIGYDLDIRQRIPRIAHDRRHKSLRASA